MHNRNSFAFVLTRASSVPQMLVCVSCQATVDGERPVSHVKMDNCDCTLCNDCLCDAEYALLEEECRAGTGRSGDCQYREQTSCTEKKRTELARSRIVRTTS